jgi:hypothetical protein
MDTDRTTASRPRRWSAIAASITIALGVVVVSLGGSIAPASAADPVPGVRGMLLGERWLPPTGGTLIEQVQYENLTPGLHYGMDVRLLNLDGTETGIEVMENVTPIAPDGSLDIELEVSESFFARSLVAVVELYLASDPSAPIAVQYDLTDPFQTVVIRGITIRGALIAERWTAADGWIVTERITYENLTPGGNYTAYAIMKFPDGTDTGAWDITRFVPSEPNGTITVDVVLPAALAGRTIVATAGMLYPPPRGDAAAVYENLTDPLQTMVVRPPLWVRSSVADKLDGDRVLAVSGGELIDTVSFDQLEPGVEYTVSGVLVQQADGAATPLTASTTFTAAAGSGSVELAYTVPAGYAGETLVSFPQLFEGTETSVVPIAVDEELDDPTQTVTVAAAVTSPSTAPAERSLTATGAEPPLLAMGIAVGVLLVGAGLVSARPRRRIR